LLLVFRRVRTKIWKANLSLFLSVRLFAPMDLLNSQWTNFREIYIRNLCYKLATSSVVKKREKIKAHSIKNYKTFYYLVMTDLCN